MFCILFVNQRQSTLRERIFGRFIKDDYSLCSVPVLKGAPFYIIRASVGQGGVNWDRIAAMAGKCARRLIYSGELPQNGYFGYYHGGALYGLMMQNTFLRILKSRGIWEHICLRDTSASCPDYILRLAPFAKRLTVITDNKEKYDDACEEILESTGMSVVLTSADCEGEITVDADASVMTVRNGKSIYRVSGGADFSAEKIYEQLLPDGVDKFDFFSALYELCGVFSIGETAFDTISVNGEKKRVDSLYFT